jgi:hypothetical protein
MGGRTLTGGVGMVTGLDRVVAFPGFSVRRTSSPFSFAQDRHSARSLENPPSEIQSFSNSPRSYGTG